MANLKDAIPSWSGYSYQGKASLLCVMQNMNTSIKEGRNLEEMCFEIEKNEDLVIYYKKMPIAIYQMKAYLKEDTRKVKTVLSAYREASKKLIENRGDLCEQLEIPKESYPALYLVTINAVKNWAEPSNKYNKNIEIYKYNENYIDLMTVIEYIQLEIALFLDSVLEQDTQVKTKPEELYLALCDFLDRKITEFHIAGGQSNYKISFKEISKLFLDVIKHGRELENARFKERVYEELHTAMLDTVSNYCSDDICPNPNGCDDCSISFFSEHLSTMDTGEYIKFLNPHISDWTLLMGRSLLEFHSDSFANLILDILEKIDFTHLIMSKDTVLINNNIFPLLSAYQEIMPTLISLRGDSERAENSLQQKMTQISSNVGMHPEINHRILSAGIEVSEPCSLKDESIRYYPKFESIENRLRSRDTLNYKLDTILFDINTIIDALEGVKD